MVLACRKRCLDDVLLMLGEKNIGRQPLFFSKPNRVLEFQVGEHFSFGRLHAGHQNQKNQTNVTAAFFFFASASLAVLPVELIMSRLPSSTSGLGIRGLSVEASLIGQCTNQSRFGDR